MESKYDVVVIGGGVVGCALVFELTRFGYSCLLLEKSYALLTGASSGNSGMIHTGYDAKEPIELDCIKRSQTRVFDILDKFNIPVKKIGATMVAWNDNQFQKLSGVIEQANNAGINVRQLSSSELQRKEPHLSRTSVGGLFIPSEAVTDPWLFPILLANDAKHKGAQIVTDCKVESCIWSDMEWILDTSCGKVHAACVVNSAGLYGDIVDKLAGKDRFRILPRKGQYTVYDSSAKYLINSSIVPVPSDIGKGVIVFRSVYDNVVVGPTAEQVESRLPAPIDDTISSRLSFVAMETVPPLAQHKIVRKYTGVRPATQYKDYIIESDTQRNWVTVGGIRSTGLSGCLGIAEKVRDLVKDDIRIEPSRGKCLSITVPEVCLTNHGTCVIDKTEYVVTHPLTITGKINSASKM